MKLPLPLYEYTRHRYVPEVPLYVTFSVAVALSPAATFVQALLTYFCRYRSKSAPEAGPVSLPVCVPLTLDVYDVV